MMRLWRYRETFTSAPAAVWVAAVDRPTLIAVARQQSGFVPVETVVVGVRGGAALNPQVGTSHFIDERSRLWFVNEVARASFSRAADLEVSLTRYGLARGLGYDVPADRSSQFGPPTGWGLVDAAGVPVQVVSVQLVVRHAFDATQTIPFYSRFFFVPAAGDSGSISTRIGRAYAVSHRQRGGRNRSGWLIPDTAGASTGWRFGFPDGDPYRSSALPLQSDPDPMKPSTQRTVGEGVLLSEDSNVQEGDFFVVRGG